MSNENHKSKVPYVKAQIDRIIEEPESKTKAYASVIIGGAFAVHSIRIIESDKGLFISMPSKSYKDKNGNIQYNDYFPFCYERCIQCTQEVCYECI